MTLAMQIVPITDAIAKYLASEMSAPVFQVAWARSAFQVVWILPLAYFSARAAGDALFSFPSSRRLGDAAFLSSKKTLRALGGHFGRGALWAGATMFFFAALSENPMPNALAVLFVAPLVVAAGAPLLIGESFDPKRALGVAAGFVGVLIVLRPAAADFRPSILFALAAGACYGGYLMATRAAMRGGGRPAQIAFYAMFAAALISTPLALAVWEAPNAKGWALMTLMGLISAAGHYLITKACEYASASLVAPFNYTEIIGACVISYLVFGDLPRGAAWAGIALIVGAGVYVSLAEYRRGRAAAFTTPPPP
jgi:drug/metabolite transporter (DMT)-like permease